MGVMSIITQGFKDAERGGLNDPSGGKDQTVEKMGEELGKTATAIAYKLAAPSDLELAQLVFPKVY